MSSPASLPKEIHRSAERGELQKVVKWLRKGGLVDAHCSTTARDGRPTTTTLLHAAASYGQLEMVRELLKRGASVDLPNSLGVTALMGAAGYGHLSIVLVLLQHSANPDLQSNRRRHRPDGGRSPRARGVREGAAASQGQHRAARRRRPHRPAARRAQGPHGHRGAPPAARRAAAACRRRACRPTGRCASLRRALPPRCPSRSTRRRSGASC